MKSVICQCQVPECVRLSGEKTCINSTSVEDLAETMGASCVCESN